MSWYDDLLNSTVDLVSSAMPSDDWYSSLAQFGNSSSSSNTSDILGQLLNKNDTPWYQSPQFWSAGVSTVGNIGSAIFGANANKDLRAQEAENSRYSVDKQYELGMAKLQADKEAAAAAAGAAAAANATAQKKIMLDNWANYIQYMHNAGMPQIQQMNQTGSEIGKYALSARSGAGARF